MKALEQLNELSDYEINCAVAEKMGHDPDHLLSLRVQNSRYCHAS